MQSSKRTAYKSNRGRTLYAALFVLSITALQGCQTGPRRYLTADEWNARTNAINAFSGAASAFSASQVPTYGGAAPMRPQVQPVIQTCQWPYCPPSY